MRLPLLEIMTSLLLLRWLHLLWACRESIISTPRNRREKDWPATGLALLYATALALFLFRYWHAADCGTVRGASALSLMIAGVILRLAGQASLGSAFSWSWVPSSELVASGIYRWMKHPLLIGYLLETAALSIAAPIAAWGSIILTAGTAALIRLQAVGEEERLEERFGNEWLNFAKGKWA